MLVGGEPLETILNGKRPHQKKGGLATGSISLKYAQHAGVHPTRTLHQKEGKVGTTPKDAVRNPFTGEGESKK